MTEKITITPKKVRGLGNIVSEKNYKDFMGMNCRSQKETTSNLSTVNGVSRNVFMVDRSIDENMTPTRLVVDGPSVVDLTDEEIVFQACLLNNDTNTVITSLDENSNDPFILRCLVNGELYEEYTHNGIATFTIPNTFEEGVYNFRFLFNLIVDYESYFVNRRVIIGNSSHVDFELLSIKKVLQENIVSPLIARLTSDGMGIKNNIIYFFERYLSNTLRLSVSEEIVQTGGTSNVSVLYKDDEDGSRIKDATIYFFERYLPLAMRFSMSKEIIQTDENVGLSAVYRDEDGSGITGATVYFFERYVPSTLRLFCSDTIVQNGDYLIFTIQMIDEDGSRIKNELVSLIGIDEEDNEVFSQNLITDSDGTNSFMYEGTARGKFNVQANYIVDGDLISSDIFSVFDVLKYDNGTSASHDDTIWDLTNTSLSRQTEYTVLSETDTSTDAYAITNIPNECTIEFELLQVDGARSSTLGLFLNSSNTSRGGFSISHASTQLNEWVKIKVELSQSEAVVINMDTNVSVSRPISNNDVSKFAFRTASGISTLYFRNFKVY